jgi:hypothetical protein
MPYFFTLIYTHNILITRTIVNYYSTFDFSSTDGTSVGLEQDIRKMQRWRYTVYSHPNETVRNEAWNSLDIDRTIIALDHDEALTLGRPTSAVFPWDKKKDIYAVSSFHQLHCLVSPLLLQAAISGLLSSIETVVRCVTRSTQRRTIQQSVFTYFALPGLVTRRY